MGVTKKGLKVPNSKAQGEVRRRGGRSPGFPDHLLHAQDPTGRHSVATAKRVRNRTGGVALVLSFLITLSGCDDGSTSSRRGGAGGRAAPTNQQRAEILVGTMATLFSLEEYELGQAQQLVMTRINQWMRG